MNAPAGFARTAPARLAAAHLLVAVAAFGVAALMGVLQGLSIADVEFPLRSESLYYMFVTAHGVLMALVFTTFFIMGLGYALCYAQFGRIVGMKSAWFAFWLALAGTVAAAFTILNGQSTVLYTFYPPMQAHPAFYIGATLLVIGSWIWGGVTIASYRSWKKDHPGTPAPMAMHGMLATIVVWYLATSGLAWEVLFMLIPWSLGWVATIDPVIARTLFWWFGHPLVYFWLMPAYVLWYTVMPRIAGGRLFSDQLARMVFILFVILSTPVGFHHQFADPGISAGWKFVHTITTFAILFPSFVTAFTVIASLEVAGRMKGAKGLFDWIGRLPWSDPFFAAMALAILSFAFGGFGGAINAAYGMNAMVHNTAWIMGHFHVTLGTTSALTFMGAMYWLMPRLLGRELRLVALARIQPWLWFIGMGIFSTSFHIAGLRGLPRRVYSASLAGDQGAAWSGLATMGAIGGVVLFLSAMAFVAVVVATWTAGRKIDGPAFEFAVPLEPVTSLGVWDRLGMWTIVGIVFVILAYAYPLATLIMTPRFGSPPFQPF
ncbi:MAG TPA: cbb3-type cytochrome c oxidase subunit I [Vicinamibacterales bacterium]|mgnify:CR=1 FL=1|jgi:cytochrome c oxidase subunit 1|nr:cbb3-type cytochrome c oxidase subunit I [Acidobacteriota bacterium]HQX80368.1 cbb3-type cytochrome c oxidase subunit I [Vicinamibacterales bacterium]